DSSTGDLTKVQDALNHVVSMTYDGRHNMLTRTAPSPLSYQEIWTYNSFDEPLSYKDGRGNQTDYGYDAGGNLTTVTAPDPDGAGPLTRPVTQYGYDEAANLKTRTVGGTKTTTYDYDNANRLIGVTSPTGQHWTYGYDADGNRTSQVDANGNSTPTSG